MTREPDHQATPDLDDIPTFIKTEWDAAHGDHGHAIYCYLRIGHALLTARRHFKSDRDYGEWFHGQGFVFGTEWARQMRLAAAQDTAVRSWWAAELDAGREPSLNRCLSQLGSTSKPATANAFATQVANDNHPESERRAWLAEQLAPRIGRGDRATRIVNDIEDALRTWETHQEEPLLDLLAPHLQPDLDADERADVVTEILSVCRGE